jgi:hypothetical protein
MNVSKFNPRACLCCLAHPTPTFAAEAVLVHATPALSAMYLPAAFQVLACAIDDVANSTVEATVALCGGSCSDSEPPTSVAGDGPPTAEAEGAPARQDNDASGSPSDAPVSHAGTLGSAELHAKLAKLHAASAAISHGEWNRAAHGATQGGEMRALAAACSAGVTVLTLSLGRPSRVRG